ncbi:MAG: hypothetical protein HOP29_04660 [Phycisphaerales bacterium]|nr:hypothetical protein [Phycisphaerales bacterium]
MNTHDSSAGPSPSLSELPLDELVRYAESLGLDLPADIAHGEALTAVRARQELLLELDRDALLDVVIWLRVPVQQSAGREQLARIITRQHPAHFDGLSDRGLHALARLRGVTLRDGEPRTELERRTRKADGWWARVRRTQRSVLGSLVARLVTASERDDDYQFLPEDGLSARTIKRDIEQSGLVGGVAKRLRGAADDYVREKLDEIERRIDRKLDEIDRRLGEWRDREMSHRLRILKITLLVTILVAVLSLLYDYFRGAS